MLMGGRPEARWGHPEDELAWKAQGLLPEGAERPLPSPLSLGPADGRFRLLLLII